MLKNRDRVGATGTESIINDDRPRKKLSFRDPEVVPLPRNGPHSAPSLNRGSPSLQRHVMMRPHSVSGMSSVTAKLKTDRSSSPNFLSGRPISLKGMESHSVPSSPASSHKVQSLRHRRNHSDTHSSQDLSKEHPRTADIPKDLPKPPKSEARKDEALRRHLKSANGKSTRDSDSSISTLEHMEDLDASLDNLDLDNQAMRIVRTIGQAFEVCHKISVKDKSPSPETNLDELSQGCSEASSDKPKKEIDSESGQEDLLTLNEEYSDTTPIRPNTLEPLSPPIGSGVDKKTIGETISSPMTDALPLGESLPFGPLSQHHELQLLREQLDQQQQQTQAAVAQVHLIRDQLAAETAARLEAQARAHQLLVHNKELIEHIQQLVLQIRELEIKKGTKAESNPQNLQDSRDLLNQLARADESQSMLWLSHLQRLNQQASIHSQLSTSYPDTPPTPSPGKTSAFLFPPSPQVSMSQYLGVKAQSREPSPREGSSPIIYPLPFANNIDTEVTLPVPHQDKKKDSKQAKDSEQKKGQDEQPLKTSHEKLRYDDKSSNPSLSSESDLKRDSNNSSGESVPTAQFGQESSWRLPQVPEDSVPLPPYGPVPLGGLRTPSGAITRAASERYSRQETLAHLQRMAWARHTTK